MPSSRSEVINYFTCSDYIKPYDSIVWKELSFQGESFGIHTSSKGLIKSEVMIAIKD